MTPVRVAALVSATAAVLFAVATEASAQTGTGVSKKQGSRAGAMGGGQGVPMPPGGMMGGGPGGPGGNFGGPTVLLSDPAVQDELKLSDAQKNRLKKIRDGQDPSVVEMHANRRKRLEKNRGAPGAGLKKADMGRMGMMAGQGGGPAEMREQLVEFDAIVMSVLDDKQAARLRQIDLQLAGVSGLTRAEVAGKLNLDNAQLKEAQAAAYELCSAKGQHNAARSRLIASLATGPQGRIDYELLKATIDGREFRSQVEKLNAELDRIQKMRMAAIKRILNKKQWDSYELMQGEPFDLDRLTNRNGNPYGVPDRGGLGPMQPGPLAKAARMPLQDRPPATTFVPVNEDKVQYNPGGPADNPENITGVAFSPDGKTIVAGYHGGGVVNPGVAVWDVATGKRRFGAPLSVNEGWVNSVAFSPDGKSIAAGFRANLDEFGGAVLWDAATGKRSAGESFAVKSGYVVSLAFSPDRKTIAAGYLVNGATSGGGVGLWDTTTHKLLGDEPYFVNEGVIASVAFSPDGKIVAAGYRSAPGPGSDKASGVLLWDVPARKRLGDAALAVNEGQVVSVAFGSDGKTILAAYGAPLGGGVGGGVVFWDLAARKRLIDDPLTVNEGYVQSMALSPDGKTIAAGFGVRGGGEGRGGVVLWDAAARNRLGDLPLAVQEGSVVTLAFSPDGKTLAAGYKLPGSGGVVLWDVATRKRLFDEPLAANEGRVRRLALTDQSR